MQRPKHDEQVCPTTPQAQNDQTQAQAQSYGPAPAGCGEPSLQDGAEARSGLIHAEGFPGPITAADVQRIRYHIDNGGSTYLLTLLYACTESTVHMIGQRTRCAEVPEVDVPPTDPYPDWVHTAQGWRHNLFTARYERRKQLRPTQRTAKATQSNA